MRASATLLLLASVTLACSSSSDPAPKAEGAPAAEASGADDAGGSQAPASTGPTAASGAAAATGTVAAAESAAATGASGEEQAAAGTGDETAAFDRAKLEALAPIGVGFCDAYIEAYRKCITFTVPAPEKGAHAATLMSEHENWARTKAGAAEVAATALEVGCRSAQAQAAQKTHALNCAWPS